MEMTARAWVHVQRGAMALDRGRSCEARAWYDAADAAYPGWWLVEVHRAEIDVLEDDFDRARDRCARMRAGSPSPELLTVMAVVIAGREPEHACVLVRRARALHAARLDAWFAEAEATPGSAAAPEDAVICGAA